jgi:hypothetical protein
MVSNDKNTYKHYSTAQMEELRALWRERSRKRVANWSYEQRSLHNKRNKAGYIPSNRYRDITQQERYNLVMQAKFDAGHCADCLMTVEPWNHVMFAWDHQPQYVKLFNLSKASKYPSVLVVAELAKCVLVCHNCHAMRTYVFKDHRKQTKRQNCPENLLSLFD